MDIFLLSQFMFGDRGLASAVVFFRKPCLLIVAPTVQKHALPPHVAVLLYDGFPDSWCHQEVTILEERFFTQAFLVFLVPF
jgi:hypothetical protein